mmetsp:Transcript_20721/g.38883  ORF Transcript_20721/g.38883 Transcript_20721/m.38883 type:complete len:265 (-) Transcript_20721:52-846(-)
MAAQNSKILDASPAHAPGSLAGSGSRPTQSREWDRACSWSMKFMARHCPAWFTARALPDAQGQVRPAPAGRPGPARALGARSDGHHGPREHKLGEGIGRQRPAEQIALHRLATLAAQEVELARGLDPLGQGLQAQRLGHADDGIDDGAVLGVLGQVAHEGLVDLELADAELLQMAERRIAGAEVIDGQADAARVQLVHHGDRNRRVVHRGAFGQLQLQALRRHAGVTQHTADQLGQVIVAELHGGQVHGHRQLGQAGIIPTAQL